ncbi:MAG: hypothetical protein HUU02_00535 [Bacteroidetes bacterium]|nr:hypothetical protein [Bacteroidota bacterium]
MSRWLCTVAAFLLFSCGTAEPEVPADLEQAAAVIERFASPMRLGNSMFAAAYPECKATQFVHYLFSDLAAAELPIGESMGDEMDRAQAQASGMPLWPDSVAMSEQVPDPTAGRQIVLTGDDTKNTVSIALYTDPKSPPVAVREVTVPHVTASEMAQAFFRSNVEMGARY